MKIWCQTSWNGSNFRSKQKQQSFQALILRQSEALMLESFTTVIFVRCPFDSLINLFDTKFSYFTSLPLGHHSCFRNSPFKKYIYGVEVNLNSSGRPEMCIQPPVRFCVVHKFLKWKFLNINVKQMSQGKQNPGKRERGESGREREGKKTRNQTG